MWYSWGVSGNQNWYSIPCSEVIQILFPGILAGLSPIGMYNGDTLPVLTEHLYALAVGLGSNGEQGPASVFIKFEFGYVGIMGGWLWG